MSSRSSAVLRVLLLTFLLVTHHLYAQTTGRIQGRVADPEGSPLPGVTVTATSPSLPGERLAVTGGEGRFHLPALPPGAYTLRATLDGFGPLEATDIRVALDRVVSLALTMSPAFGDRLTVTAAAQLLDPATTTTGAEFSDQLFTDLPLSRDYQDLALKAPGTTDGGLEGNPSVRGASALENRYLVEGLDVTDAAYGWLVTSLPFEFIDEVEVKTGGYEAEYGGALGGVINVITKSGGNEIHGDLFAYYHDSDLQASSPLTQEFGQIEGFTKYDLGLDLGGKIVEDQLWYFLALNSYVVEDDVTNRQAIPITARTERLAYAGKLTGTPAPDHRLTFSVFGDPTDERDAYDFFGGSFNTLDSAGRVLHDFDRDSNNAVLRYDWTSGDHLLEVTAGRYTQDHLFEPTSEDAPWYIDATGSGFWAQQLGCGDPDLVSSGDVWFVGNCDGGAAYEVMERTRDQITVAYSRFLGEHELQVGGTYRAVETFWDYRIAGPHDQPMVDDQGVVVYPEGTLGAYFLLFSDSYLLIEEFAQVLGKTDEGAFFVQDRWRATPDLTLNLGLRLEQLDAKGPFENRRLDFGLDDMLAPRLGFNWDPTRQGRSRLYGHFGRFFESVPQVVNVVVMGDLLFSLHGFLYPEDGSLPDYDNLGTVSFGGGGLNTWEVDPRTVPSYADEVVLGFEYQIRPRLVLSATGVYREVGDVMEDVRIDEAGVTLLTNPERPIASDPATGAPLGEPVVLPRPVRDYQALEITVRRPLADSWQLLGSYVYSENEGNYEGLNRSDSHGGYHAHYTRDFDTPALMKGAFGPLPMDRRHQLKLYGSYLFESGLVAGFFGSYASGRPVSRYGYEDHFFTSTRFVGSRGDGGRTSSLWHLDLHLAYPLKLPGGLELHLIADVFNLTNQQSEVTVDQTWSFMPLAETTDPGECGGPGTGPGTACPWGNPAWGTPTRFQSPRTVRFGARLSW